MVGARAVSLAVTLALLGLLAVTNIYRAATQSFTAAEWSAQARLLGGSAPQIRTLDVALSEGVVRVFGTSELALRLPSVAGGLLYFLALFLLGRLLFRDSAWLFGMVALNALNPYVLDECSMAAGRGLGMALWTLGAYYLARWVVDARRIPIGAGLALGLAVACDVQQAFAVAALEMAFFGGVILARLRAGNRRGAWRFLVADGLPFCLTSVVTAWAILRVALGNASLPLVAETAPHYLAGVTTLASALVLHSPLARFAWVLLAALAILLALAVVRGGRLPALFAWTAALTFLLLWLEPRANHHAYYAGRALAFTQPLVLIACPLLLATGAGGRVVSAAGTALVAFLLMAFAFQFQVHSYSGLESDSASRTVVEILRSRHNAGLKASYTIAAPARLQVGLLPLRDSNWLRVLSDGALECPADFYYLPAEHFERLGSLGLVEISRDKVAGTVLAEVGPDARQRLAVLREIGFPDTPQCNAGVLATESWIECARGGAARHFLRGVQDMMEPDRWRWTFERPAILFHVPRRDGVRFKMDFAIHGPSLGKMMPLELTVRVNGKELGRRRYLTPGSQTFEQAVPPGLLRADGVALVETELDKYYVSPLDGQKLGYLFERGGFLFQDSGR